MVNMNGGSKEREKVWVGSPKAKGEVGVGEIDTRAPFQSVKAAVNLFVEVATPKARPAASFKIRRLSSEVYSRKFYLITHVSNSNL